MRGICWKCKKTKDLTRHSLKGHHRPPYIRVCRKCHDKIHGIEQNQIINKKYQPGTKRMHKKKKRK